MSHQYQTSYRIVLIKSRQVKWWMPSIPCTLTFLISWGALQEVNMRPQRKRKFEFNSRFGLSFLYLGLDPLISKYFKALNVKRAQQLGINTDFQAGRQTDQGQFSSQSAFVIHRKRRRGLLEDMYLNVKKITGRHAEIAKMSGNENQVRKCLASC